MRVLIITGDRRFGPGHERYELQRGAVERLEVVHWGRESLVPRLPQGPFDVVTAQDPFYRGLFGWYAARRLGARLNVQVHADLSAQRAMKRAVARFVLRHADSVRVVSPRVKEQVLRLAPGAAVTVLPVFVGLERFRGLVPQPHSQKTILWTGRFENEKDPLRAVGVLAAVRAAGADAKLVMLGAGSLEPQLRELVSRLNLEEYVEFPGWQDPAQYVPLADVVLSTSKAESWGASIVEALAAGVPVVAPNVGIAKEAGAVVASRDQLAAAVVGVLRAGTRGQLKLPMLTKEQWAAAWVRSLA